MTTIKINLAATTCQEKTGLSKKCVRFFQDETLTTHSDQADHSFR